MVVTAGFARCKVYPATKRLPHVHRLSSIHHPTPPLLPLLQSRALPLLAL